MPEALGAQASGETNVVASFDASTICSKGLAYFFEKRLRTQENGEERKIPLRVIWPSITWST